MAATLDRAAQSAVSSQTRRTRWREAVRILETFNHENPKHPLERQFTVQAAVYLWAIARIEIETLRYNPRDSSAREKAANDLTASIQRLRSVVDSLTPKDVDVFAQNARYRLAQALADLGDAASNDQAARLARTREALVPLESPITEPSLKGFAHLLRATLLTRLGQLDDAQFELDAAAKSSPVLPDADLLEAKIALLIATRRFDEVAKLIESAKIDPAAKPLTKIRALLAVRFSSANRQERSSTEKEIFRELQALRDAKKPETRAGLIAVAAAMAEPEEGQAPVAWDLMAEGALALGDPNRAGVLASKAADRATGDRLVREAAEYRLEAGAYFYQAEKYAEADAILTSLAEDSAAGPNRAKAGLLRAIARGRAFATEAKGATRAKYVEALQYQVKSFPKDPSTAEARWLLGKFRLASGDRTEAEALWKEIPVSSSRWFDARLEVAALHQQEVDAQRLNNDRDALRRRLEAARTFLTQSIEEARGSAGVSLLQLAAIRLELTPISGRPEQAMRILDQLDRAVTSAQVRDTARRLRIVALVELNRFPEAEQAARKEAKASDPTALVEVIRLLDRFATETESDLRMRRTGLVLKELLASFVGTSQKLSPELLAEIRLRNVRAMLFTADETGARRALSSWTDSPPTSTDEVLRDLADTYTKLTLYSLAEDVQRLRGKRAATGSLPWFDARYGLALAYFRAGKAKESLHLIDATAILHPDLGGGELRDKFIKLRQRIDPTG